MLEDTVDLNVEYPSFGELALHESWPLALALYPKAQDAIQSLFPRIIPFPGPLTLCPILYLSFLSGTRV